MIRKVLTIGTGHQNTFLGYNDGHGGLKMRRPGRMEVAHAAPSLFSAPRNWGVRVTQFATTATLALTPALARAAQDHGTVVAESGLLSVKNLLIGAGLLAGGSALAVGTVVVALFAFLGIRDALEIHKDTRHKKRYGYARVLCEEFIGTRFSNNRLKKILPLFDRTDMNLVPVIYSALHGKDGHPYRGENKNDYSYQNAWSLLAAIIQRNPLRYIPSLCGYWLPPTQHRDQGGEHGILGQEECRHVLEFAKAMLESWSRGQYHVKKGFKEDHFLFYDHIMPSLIYQAYSPQSKLPEDQKQALRQFIQSVDETSVSLLIPPPKENYIEHMIREAQPDSRVLHPPVTGEC